jgi:hypothetical protein
MRYSSVAYGVALGMGVVALVGIVLTVAGIAPNPAAFAWLFALCVGGVPSAELLIEWRRMLRNDRLNEREKDMALREREHALSRTAALTPARLSRLVPVNGGQRYIEMLTERPARWLAWQHASEELLLWYLETGALTVEALCGRGTRKAFSDRTAWGLMLAEWHRVGLARKENGVPTVMLKTPDEVRLLLERGDVEWTLEADPPAIRPAPQSEVLEHRPIVRKLA